MKKGILIIIIALLGCAASSYAQGRRGLRINEVMVANDTSMVDDFGEHNAWVELFNSTYGPLEISSVFITDDKNNQKKYPVPLGDVNTEVPTRQHVLFWADGAPSKGTFHMNFKLKPGETNWIGVYDADGKTLIDEVEIPADLKANQSYARKVDGVRSNPSSTAFNAADWEVRDGEPDAKGIVAKPITPSSANKIKDTNNKVDSFRENDEHGFALSIMAMCIVFLALLVLCVCFYIINRIGINIAARNKMRATGHEPVEGSGRPAHDSGEEIAAIAMALHDHLNAHDQEQTVLTINKVKKAYSPWSSKIYNMRQLPTKR